jgi:thiol-disulfide isomerase/thioredoxin
MAKNKSGRTRKNNKKQSRSVMGRLMPPVDIQNESQLGELKKRIAAGPLTLVFVYADWCGHCQSYKPKMDELEAMPDRTIQTARIRDDVFPKSNLHNAKLEGYPTLMLVKKNGEATTFQTNDGSVSNAIPDHTNMTNMKAIVKNMGTPQGLNLINNPAPIPASTMKQTIETIHTNNSNIKLPTNSPFSNTNSFEEEPINQLNTNVETMQPLTTLGSTSITTSPNTARINMPASIVADQLSSPLPLNNTLLNSKNALVQESTRSTMNSTSVKQAGGSLWSQLILASNKIAPAAALLLGSVALNKRNTRSKKHVKRRITRKN